MPTASKAADLATLAEHTLAAANAAASILAAHPDLPIERLHADGIDGQNNIGPLLEIQVGDNPGVVATWAASAGATVEQTPFLGRTQHRATAQIGGVTVMVTAYEDAAEAEEAEEDEYWAN